MKILRLDLFAFGPFTRQTLVFEEREQGLHIVYGPNEAGKTSTLRALRGLLYGIPSRSSDDFRHAYRELRIGALLRGPDGQTLECIRRKGNKNTLRGPNDADSVDEGLLARFLAGVSEEAFCRQFGIDHAQLVAGGREIAEGGGEIGQILFAAASGFKDLNNVCRSLAAEADVLFSPSAQVKPINRAINDLKERRKIVRESQLSSSAWKTHHDAHAAVVDRRRKLQAQQMQLNAELARLNRIQAALPDITRRQETLQELLSLPAVPPLPADFAEHRRAAENQASLASSREREASEASEALQGQIAGLEVSEVVLSHAEFIETLYKSAAIHLKAEDDARTKLIPDRSQLLRQADELLRDLGRDDLDVQSAEALRLNMEERRRIQKLAGAYAGLLKRLDLAEQRERELRQEAEATQHELSQLPAVRDAASLKRALTRWQKQGDVTGRLAGVERDLVRVQKKAQTDFQRLPLWQGSPEDLPALPLPLPETIADYENRLANAAADCDKLESQLAETRRQCEDVEEKLRQLDLQHDVPTVEALTAARAHRHEGWRLIRTALQGETPRELPEYLAGASGAATLKEAYELSVQQADDLADRLRREAERVGEKSQLMAYRDKQRARLAELTSQFDAAQRREEQLRAEWEQQWRPAGIVPQSPREMRAWVAQHAAVVETIETLHRLADESTELKAQIERHAGELFAGLVQLEPSQAASAGQDVPVDDLAARCETAIETLEQTAERRRQLERDAARQHRELETAAEELRSAQEELSQWRSDWRQATERLRLAEDAEPADAAEVLSALDQLFKNIDGAEELTERIEAIAANAATFSQNVKNACDGAAPDLRDEPYHKAIAELYKRLTAAKEARLRLTNLQSNLADAQKRGEAARHELLEAEAELKVLCREAGCQSPGQLAAVEEQARQRNALQQRLQETEDRLHHHAAGKLLEDFIQESLSENPDELATAVDRLKQQLEAIQVEWGEVNRIIGIEENELKRMDGSANAAAAQEEAEQLVAQLRDDAERYVRLRLAAEVLQGAVQRHRERNQGPVLRRASELFRDLTLGSFSGLKVDYDDANRALLLGVRGDGQTTPVEGMSDGSCDQLYLALRLASLEHYLENHPPLPFIVDDILITFDDERAAAALHALNELSRRTQVIFFTHHRHLVDLAEAQLPKQALSVQCLSGVADGQTAPGNESKRMRVEAVASRQQMRSNQS